MQKTNGSVLVSPLLLENIMFGIKSLSMTAFQCYKILGILLCLVIELQNYNVLATLNILSFYRQLTSWLYRNEFEILIFTSYIRYVHVLYSTFRPRYVLLSSMPTEQNLAMRGKTEYLGQFLCISHCRCWSQDCE